MQIAIFILQVLYFGSGGIELYIYTGQMAMGIRMKVTFTICFILSQSGLLALTPFWQHLF